MNHSTYDALLQSVVESVGKDRWVSMSILADFLEEQGNPVAAGWRELARLKKWPQEGLDHAYAVVVCWIWWRYDRRSNRISGNCLLARGVWDRLIVGTPYGIFGCCLDYSSAESALEDAAQAVAKWLTEKGKLVK